MNKIYTFNNIGNTLQCCSHIHHEDHIFNFIKNHPQFPNENKAVENYFSNGKDSAEKLKSILDKYGMINGSLLEFASGYGCVTRHMKNVLPNMNIVACDIHTEAVNFISENIKCETILSKSVPDELNLTQYSIVFALSFFSHMPLKTWEKWLQKLYSFVASNGILIFTCHSETSANINNVKVDSTGFYFKAESEQLDISLAEYGTTYSLPNFVFNCINKLNNVELVEFRPAYWWSHQDLYIIKRKNIP